MTDVRPTTRLAVACTLALAACTPPPVKVVAPLADPITAGTGDRVAAMRAELQDEILESYDRDDPPEIETGMLNPAIGGARIGAAADDLLIGDELAKAPTRWPIAVDHDTPFRVLSKHLEVHFAKDETAAWMSDELSWRVTMCGRVAVIPLRMTALYAHDGDRWIPVFEHLSFAHQPVPAADDKPHGRAIRSAVVSRELADDLSRTLQSLIYRTVAHEPAQMATEESTLLGPGPGDEWHDRDAATAQLVPGTLRADEHRVGTVGRNADKATVAYWIGNLTADLPASRGVAAGRARLRGTFVFEKRADRWVIVQGQVSAPIEDPELATAVFGTALVALDPLRVTCDDGSSGPAQPPPSAIATPAAAPTDPAPATGGSR